jgi:hypothetical protein
MRSRHHNHFKPHIHKSLTLLSAIFVMSLSGMGCNKSGKLSQPSTFTPPSGPVELKLKWPQGEQILQEMDMKRTMEFSIPGRSSPVKQDMSMEQEYGLTVLNATPDGEREVEMEFLNARVKMMTGTKALPNYDSAKKTAADEANPVAKLFGKIIGSKIEFFLNASNQVERMDGVDALTEKLASGRRDDQLDGFRNQFSEGNLKQMMSASLFMPPRAVQPGDTWPVHIEFPMGTLGTMVVDDEFTFQRWEMHGERNCARLEFQGTVTNKLDMDPNLDRMSVSITDGDASGVFWFDPELGITIDTTVNLNLNLLINIPMRRRDDLDGVARTQHITSQLNEMVNTKLISVK